MGIINVYEHKVLAIKVTQKWNVFGVHINVSVQKKLHTPHPTPTLENLTLTPLHPK
jgi:hypothetical protein